MKLMLFNGTTGVGKSTLTRALLQELPKSFLVDVDSQRKIVSNYRDDPKESRERAYEVSNAIIELNLKSGYDVIVDRTSVNPKYIDGMLEIGERYKADTYEFILQASKETVLKRADGRGYRPDGLLTRESVEEIWDEIQELIPKRKNAIVIDTEDLTPEDLLEKVIGHLNS